MSKKVSVIVPIYNAEAYIDQCIQSILNQSYPWIELILVDDGSSDQCPDICDGYASRDKRVCVIHQANSGAQISRHSGLSKAEGEFVLFVDCDDWIEPDTVACCVATAQRDQADCVLFAYTREYPNRSIENPLFDRDYSFTLEESESMVHRRIVGAIGNELRQAQRIDNFVPVWLRLYRTEIAKKGRIISERVIGTSEDTVFNLYALDNCKISYINRCFYHYRKANSQSITTAHKAGLPEKWDTMYRVIEEYINESGKAEQYRTPFLNRVACGMIGLGINEVSSPVRFSEKCRRLKAIVNRPLYAEAFAQLDTSYCDPQWKLFFLLCKKNAIVSLTILLEIMHYLRSHGAG